MWNDLIVALIAAAGAALASYLIYKNWDQIRDKVTAWAREKKYQGVLRLVVRVEDVRAGVKRAWVYFLGPKDRPPLPEPILVTEGEIAEHELPVEFQRTGFHPLELTVDGGADEPLPPPISEVPAGDREEWASFLLEARYWARQQGYTGLLRLLLKVETTDLTGMCHCTLFLVSQDGQSPLSTRPLVATAMLPRENLPSKLQADGIYKAKLTI